MSKDKKPAPKVQTPSKQGHDPAVTAANRARRIAKDKALKERAKRKREQRMLRSPNLNTAPASYFAAWGM